MSCTLLKSLAIYKNHDLRENKTLFTIIVNAADSSVRPLSYSRYSIACGDQYEIVRTIGKLAGNTFDGELHWHNTWNDIENTVDFFNYAVNKLKTAKEISGAVPGIEEYFVLSYKPDDLCADIFEAIGLLKQHQIKENFGRKSLVIIHPTINEIYWGNKLHEYYKFCTERAEISGEVDQQKKREYFITGSARFPEKYRKIIQEKANA